MNKRFNKDLKGREVAVGAAAAVSAPATSRPVGITAQLRALPIGGSIILPYSKYYKSVYAFASGLGIKLSTHKLENNQMQVTRVGGNAPGLKVKVERGIPMPTTTTRGKVHFKVENDIPLPSKNPSTGWYKEFLSGLNTGQSFVCSISQRPFLVALGNKMEGRKFTSRTLSGGKNARVWRIE